MMTPQEVSGHVFSKASFGGYNMAMVDEFLDQLTGDYADLYKENASLKAKMKVLSDSLEEYRATEKGMRRALLAAQQAAEEMVKEAEARKDELLRSAEDDIQARIEELHRQEADAQARLEAAQAATNGYVEKLRAISRCQEEFLRSLDEITAGPVPEKTPDTVTQAAQAIEESVQKLMEDVEDVAPAVEDVEEDVEEKVEEEVSEDTMELPSVPSLHEESVGRSRRDQERARAFEEVPAPMSQDTMPTRRIDFSNLQFGTNYDLK